MFEVLVSQKIGTIRFEFNKMIDALEFVQTCVECGDEGTEVNIKDVTNKEED